MLKHVAAGLLAVSLVGFPSLLASATDGQLAKAEEGTTLGHPTQGPENQLTEQQLMERYPGVPLAMLTWESEGFYPTEFCWKIERLEPTFPQYWPIRRYCDRKDQMDDWM